VALVNRVERIAVIGAAIVACAGLLPWSRPVAAAAPDVSRRLIVRVYDAAAVPSDDLAEATAAAHHILASAGVPAEWIQCGPHANSCSEPLGPTAVAVRLVALATPDDYRGPLPMGDALIDAGTRTGSLATIYTDRIAWLARAGESDARVLMGRAMAHEIGHLLLGTHGHATHGLMRARWSEAELRRSVPADWLFSPTDAQRIREAFAGRAY
jgi:hypothetical protein